ncbi:MAG: DUF115 domain-containing protein, partial [Nannocystaceae bacterium]|nr:DUF115 domain-containing protein [Nannocystaceae bacterium]
MAALAAALAPSHAPDGAPSALAVVWGLGSGRRARALLREGATVILYAIDVAPERGDVVEAVVSACERLRDARREGRLTIVHGSAAALARAFRALPAQGVQMHVDLAALASVPEPARPLARLVERLHLEQTDLHRFAARMRDNLRENLDALCEAAPMTVWHDAARGRPAFVLAAGPSARAAMSWLGRAREHGPLLAVDTALPLCREHGLDVDCLVSVDPHPRSALHLSRGCDGVAALAMQPFCAPAVVQAFPRRVCALPQGDLLCDAVARALQLPQVHAGGTVLLYALQLAAMLGCDPIVLVGADLAHVGGLSHAAGTATSTPTLHSGTVAPTSSGGVVPTTAALQRFRGEIEDHVTHHPHATWWVDGGGAIIEGTRRTTGDAMAR